MSNLDERTSNECGERIEMVMASLETILRRSDRLLRHSYELLTWSVSQTELDQRCLEMSASAISESRAVIKATDRTIAGYGALVGADSQPPKSQCQ
jgi:hypothetical protein